MPLVVQGRILDQAMWVRLALIAVLFGYIVIISVSHLIPLPLWLQGPLVLTGWLFLLGLFLGARQRRIDTRPSAQPPVMELLRPWALAAAFGALVAVALFLAVVWDVPSICQGPVPLNCFKGYQWSVDSGRYYHTTADGAHAEISRQTYVQEVGFDLRSASVFGLLSLSAAWIGAAVFRRDRDRPSSEP